MIDLEKISEAMERTKKLQETLRRNNAPATTLRYYDGVIDTYQMIICGGYEKKCKADS